MILSERGEPVICIIAQIKATCESREAQFFAVDKSGVFKRAVRGMSLSNRSELFGV